MTQIKTFTNHILEDLENDVNNFLTDQHYKSVESCNKFKVKDIRITEIDGLYQNSDYMAVITYEIDE